MGRARVILPTDPVEDPPELGTIDPPGPKLGRGRPPAKLPDEVIQRIGPRPTDDPVAAAKWVSKLLLELAWLECCGLAPQKLGERVRATAGAIIRAMPDHVRAELDARIRGDDAGNDADAP